MEITDVKVIPVDDEKLKAFVSIVFDQCFVVTDIKIINGPCLGNCCSIIIPSGSPRRSGCWTI